MITIKVLNEFGRTTASCDLSLFGGTGSLTQAIVDFVSEKDVCGVHITISVAHDLSCPTLLWDAIEEAVEPYGIRHVKLTIRTPRHNVVVGSSNFSPLMF